MDTRKTSLLDQCETELGLYCYPMLQQPL